MRGQINGHRVVEINGFGHTTSAYSYGWDPTTDGAKVFANALLYTIPSPTFSVAKQIAFTTQALYTQSGAYTLTYTNSSAVAQTLTSLSFTGTHIGDFAVSPSSSLPAVVPPGGTFDVYVTFLPSGIGLRAATLVAGVQGATGPATTLVTGTGG